MYALIVGSTKMIVSTGTTCQSTNGRLSWCHRAELLSSKRQFCELWPLTEFACHCSICTLNLYLPCLICNQKKLIFAIQIHTKPKNLRKRHLVILLYFVFLGFVWRLFIRYYGHAFLWTEREVSVDIFDSQYRWQRWAVIADQRGCYTTMDCNCTINILSNS